MAAISPEVALADPQANARRIGYIIKQTSQAGASVLVTPEMSLTGYTCADLFHNRLIVKQSIEALMWLAAESSREEIVAFIGLPIEYNGALYNAAAAISKGKILAVIPKTYIPNYNEFYECRWFESAMNLPQGATINLGSGNESVPFGTDIIIDCGTAKIGVEICEDLWSVIPPSSYASLAGAEVIVNLSASNDLVGKRDYLTDLIVGQSARCNCAYVYASAGWGESTTDLVFDGKAFVAANGHFLAATEPWVNGENGILTNIDIDSIRRERIHNRSFSRSQNMLNTNYRCIKADIRTLRENELYLSVNPHPFVPSDGDELTERCNEIINIQSFGLARRLTAANCKNVVIGISGGLDSTLALLVACRAFDILGLPRTGITGVTMPGFGTTGRTYGNALSLMQSLGITLADISIADAVKLHFRDIGHDGVTTDVTYENSQARERTQILMDLANKQNAMVVGTGDMSELALGWATYNGDHMSMYGVNAGVPKTLVKHLVTHFAEISEEGEAIASLLYDIVNTPISPELTPADAEGNIAQKTEDLVGPYELHDFFLYRLLRHGESPKKIFQLAAIAFDGTYDKATILKWLRTFFRRFFAQQFKRSCLPDGPKVGSVCLSPRGDWRMPSDARSSAWLAEIDLLETAIYL